MKDDRRDVSGWLREYAPYILHHPLFWVNVFWAVLVVAMPPSEILQVTCAIVTVIYTVLALLNNKAREIFHRHVEALEKILARAIVADPSKFPDVKIKTEDGKIFDDVNEAINDILQRRGINPDEPTPGCDCPPCTAKRNAKKKDKPETWN